MMFCPNMLLQQYIGLMLHRPQLFENWLPAESRDVAASRQTYARHTC